MTTPATHNDHDNTPERVLFMAFELSEKTWKLGFTTGHGQQPRERGVAARSQACVLQEVAQAKKRFGLPSRCDGSRFSRMTAPRVVTVTVTVAVAASVPSLTVYMKIPAPSQRRGRVPLKQTSAGAWASGW